MMSNGDDGPLDTLQELYEVRRRTRAAVHPAWFPLLVFGLLGLLSIPVTLVAGGSANAVFWLLAGPAGGYATSHYYRDRAISLGAGVRGRAYLPLGIFIFLGAWGGGALTHSAAVPMAAIALGYLAFARLERSWAVAGVALVLGAAALAVAITEPRRGDLLLSLVFGLSFTVTGLLLRHRDPVR